MKIIVRHISKQKGTAAISHCPHGERSELRMQISRKPGRYHHPQSCTQRRLRMRKNRILALDSRYIPKD